MKSSEDFFNLGNESLEKGEFEAAIAAYDEAIALDPDSYLAWGNRGLSLDNLGHYEEAIASYEKAGLLNPDYYESWSNRGSSLSRLGRYEEAIAAYDKALSLNPDSYLTWYNQGISLNSLGRYEAAITSHSKAISLNPNVYRAWFGRGVSLDNLGRYEAAITSYSKAISLNPEDYKTWSGQGASLLKLGRYEAAVSSYNKAVELKPDDYQAWSNQGLSLLKLDQHKEAIASFDKAVALNPEDYRAWLLRGVSLNNLGRYEAAVSSHNKAVALNSNVYQAWSNRGAALANLGQYETAIDSYDRAIALNSDDYETWFGQGVSFDALGRYEAAITAYDQTILLNPDFYLAWSNRGTALYNVARYEAAIASYDKAIAINPDNYPTWTGRGSSLRDLGHYEAAIASYDKAIAINPNDYQALCGRGIALFRLERKEEAIEAYERATIINPVYYQAWINRATAICGLSTQKLSDIHLITVIQKVSLPALNQPEPHIAALQEAFPRLIEGSVAWGQIHLHLGDAYLKHSQTKQNPSLYWRDAIRSYQSAYPILTGEDRLSVLQGLIRVYLAFEDTLTARTFQQEGQLLFEQLKAAKSKALKPTFARKFSSFSQLEIDLLVSEQNPIEAIKQAEFYKNRCLTWILDHWQEAPESPSYSKIRSIVRPRTAIIYWHLSIDSLTTFILTNEQYEPQVLSSRRPQAKRFTTWLGTYNSQYRNYANQKSKDNKKLANHPWRKSLENQLVGLRDILQIDTISEQLPSTVQNLILVPHRDLHCVPLQTLFAERFTCTFLPSLQIGLKLQERLSANKITPLLNVGDPQTEQAEMPFARIESAVVQQLVKDTTPIEGHNASLENVIKALQQPYKALHFTGHGAYDSRKPSESALGLVDSLLTAKQISQLDLSSYQLVCLAACETALTGKESIPDEYVGLASAFLKAGAKNVLSTLWPVDEIASTWIMIRFYQNLLSGNPPATALKLAQHWLQSVSNKDLADWILQLLQIEDLPSLISERLEARAENTFDPEGTMNPDQLSEYQHPYYWAAFTLVGQG